MINEFIVIDVMNEAMIKTLGQKKANYEENLRIREYLKDEAFFFKINKENAYKVLKNVGVKNENLEKVYKKLISPDTFFQLINKGKIDKNNNSLVVKYDDFKSSEEIFNNKK